MKRAGAGTATGANGFQRRGVDAAFAQKSRQQRRQNRFAGARIRAGDEKCSLQFADMKTEMPKPRNGIDG